MSNTGVGSGQPSQEERVCVVAGPIVVGAGPSGLAVAASLRRLSVPSLIIERSDGIAHLWRHCAYDRLSLHLPKHFCELPHLRFPANYHTYPSKAEFVDYLQAYAEHFDLHPVFRCEAVAARYDPTASMWRVSTVHGSCEGEEEVKVEYLSPWLVVATGENAERVVPEVKGMEVFKGGVLHSSEYRNGLDYEGKKVLVLGCGNSGMEMCLDLCEHGAFPFMSVRSRLHVLPREMLGFSTFELAMRLCKLFPVRLVDKILILLAWFAIGDTGKYGLKRPKIGPMELKKTTGKTPVLDVGAMKLIKRRKIKVVAEVESLTMNGAKFADGREMEFDSVIFATGYRSNVPILLKAKTTAKDSPLHDELPAVFSEDGKPKTPFPKGWKEANGLYCVGFTGRGILGASLDAVKAAQDIADRWKEVS
ncbi:hypothetical protein HPP92_023230 [Vanilla planifolia]|uniref:Flavin-containing monooxygenase n=1 Tax=Vanilla planifolia TaxID=51239 RepID=A0A835UFV4_VANPL|nr:hypothetical protein HPP92_023230 [Vanilla planifolia]